MNKGEKIFPVNHLLRIVSNDMKIEVDLQQVFAHN